jgi:hypothetical protein
MLTPLPRLFHPDHIQSHQTCERFDALAQQQLRRVHWALGAMLAVSLASAVPQLQGAGPMLTLAGRAWPELFGAILAWADKPTEMWEIVTGLIVLGLGAGVLGFERLKLRYFRSLLKPLEMAPFEREVLDAEGENPPSSVSYLRAVEKKRPLRMGDWKLSLELLYKEFPDLED